MSKTRIAVFEGYGRAMGYSTRQMPRGMGYSTRTMPRGMGAPLFNNPRTERIAGYGRRGYYVPPLYESGPYGPVTSGGRRAKAVKRKGYKVKKGRNSPWQVKFKKAAKTCARKARGKRKGTYQSCMRVALKKRSARRSRRSRR